MKKIWCYIWLHDWTHCHEQGVVWNKDRTEVTGESHKFYKKCKHCGHTAPDPESERFANFCTESRKAGLSTEEMRILTKLGKY